MTAKKAEVKESKTAMVRRLLTEGKSEDKVTQAMTALYVSEGKSEDWSKKRGKGILKLFLKEFGHPSKGGRKRNGG